ncbi:acyl-CoA reductase-like NAD-dependent aldehyde dehydrogenase [Mycolicibacterium sp. BK556]|uniref:aldehyde dehydrogenase family protein n=1 Tax=Mycobacteriaceae TaxID=1762 RepID=UPI00105FB095|nr:MULTISPECIES: aldehyde dehydrogenase family protein [Mycobacteriaceae]MBB3602867.1 acyl-CoA reductase-like NAD-dependent aldehyde dehydrogenase [Mycolicibacterium sp. BK556]MBB3633062.1 acyl-CoA reductase-like NAD-dependent aldehyde dehydrogenase [Mycolicibacterium sp. BK607]MBB3750612.1 acyl-CoA reductase-like NAD-dependent aldehyde dehydrogenase [Mycolicibacterium sp. BK634]TDO07037.1 acyl-CoA reductase-like NAD-dependent aldehyde dehydrogenase [Mycobacterium sp. BK086]
MTNVDADTGVLAGEQRMLIDGELRFTDSGATFDVVHPASEEVVGQATDGTVTDIERATAAARRAFDTTDWSRDLDFRYHCLNQLHEALTEEQERLRRIVITEVGCPVSVSGSQIESPIAEVKHWAEHGKNFDYLVDTGIHETQMGPARRKIQYDPVGVVGAITPWNVPFYLNIAETIPALMAGNTVVLKPAQLTPWSGTELGRIIAEKTDIPAGVFNVVTSNANEVGAALSADPRVDMITFTGSTATGRAIVAAGASTVKKTLLELGGKSTHIVCDDADFNACLPMAAMFACVMSGQSCILSSRVLLPRSRYDEGLEILKTMMANFPVGDPWTPGNLQGPQISAAQREKTLGLIQSGIADGARLITGGGIPENLPTGYYVQPTLLADVDPTSEIAQTEIFGPVITVTPYDTDDEAVEISNNTIYGLSGDVTSGDDERALNIALRLRTGSVTTNGHSFFGITSPFGGTKQSGLGHRNGDEGYREYLNMKTIGVRP